MRLSSLCLAAVLTFSPALAAQHSSGGGSSGGGGGSHTSSGGSGSSGGSASSHSSSGSSGGSVSHRAAGSHNAAISQGGSVHSSGSGIGGSRSVVSSPHSNAPTSIRQPNSGLRTKSETVGKKGFFSFLRWPIRRPQPKAEPKPVADLRGRLCFKGPCLVCPTGRVHGGGCLSGFVPQHRNNFCSAREIWNGGTCLLQTRFGDDCSGLRFAMERQAQRMRAAESVQQITCASAATQECSDLTNTSLSETSLYRALQSRYRQCRQSITAYPFGGTAVWSYASGLSFDALVTDWDNR